MTREKGAATMYLPGRQEAMRQRFLLQLTMVEAACMAVLETIDDARSVIRRDIESERGEYDE